MTCTALVLGAGGFIGSHMVRRLKREGYWVRGVDLKRPEFSSTEADEFIQGDLTDPLFVERILRYTGSTGNFYKQDVPRKYWHPFHEVYQFAADMGGAGFIFTGENDAEIMHNSATINLNVLHEQKKLNNLLDRNYTKIFYSSSACMYPAYQQESTDDPKLPEEIAYPAAPDSEYGWEKLFSERLYLTFNRNHNIPVRIARYHNIFGPEGTWKGGCNDLIREKLGWDYEQSLEEGIRKTYEWIVDQDPNATEHAQLEDSLDYETSIFAG
jgi:GDP-D-mannose 3',5'-epimerase